MGRFYHEESGSVNKIVRSKSSELMKMVSDSGIDVKGLVDDDDFSEVYGRCCENILGFRKIPIGLVNRRVIVNGEKFWIPICTTEGALVASISRGVKLINMCGGLVSLVENLGATRSFTITFSSFREAAKFYIWLKTPSNEEELKREGESTSRYLKIKSISSKHLVGNEVIVKVYAYTGDAMGMNMITKACRAIALKIEGMFGAKTSSISSNICTDKKWSIENYANGRGRRVSSNILIDNDSCKMVLGVSIHDMLKVYHSKIVIGSSMVLGGFNSQAANCVAGMFLALGQDVAHVIESSNCVIEMKTIGEYLSVSTYMPSIMVGVIGGGTHLEPAKSFLKQFDRPDNPECIITDRNIDVAIMPNYLALAVAACVTAGELSVMASLSDKSLVDAHLKLNRKKDRSEFE